MQHIFRKMRLTQMIETVELIFQRIADTPEIGFKWRILAKSNCRSDGQRRRMEKNTWTVKTSRSSATAQPQGIEQTRYDVCLAKFKLVHDVGFQRIVDRAPPLQQNAEVLSSRVVSYGPTT